MEVGFSYLFFRRLAEAREAPAQAVPLNPRVYLARLLYGVALHAPGEREAAAREYNRAADLSLFEGTPRHLLADLEQDLPPPPLVEDTLVARGTAGQVGEGRRPNPFSAAS